MERIEKSLGVAYFFWLLVGVWGGHRIYLRRQASALVMIAMHLGGWALVIGSVNADAIWMTWVGIVLVAAVGAWVLVDALFMPSMVSQWNDKLQRDDGPFMPGAFSNDPGFQATLAKAGADGPARSGKRAIPEGYEMPWRRPDGGVPQARQK